MFDLTSSKLMILAVVALLVVGPKDLINLMRTLGRYYGVVLRQANEFKSQFEEAMRESELADLKKEVEDLGKETSETLRQTTDAIQNDMNALNSDINQSLAAQTKVDEDAWNQAVMEMEKPLEADPGAVEPTSLEAPQPPVPAPDRVVSVADSDDEAASASASASVSPAPPHSTEATAEAAGAEPSRGGA